MYSSTPLLLTRFPGTWCCYPDQLKAPLPGLSQLQIQMTNKVWVKRRLFEMIWLILQWSAVYNCFITSMTFFRVAYFSAIFPCFFFNFSYKYKLKSRLLEIPFLIPALYSEMQRTNVSSPWWHSFVPLIFPGTHSPIFIDYTSPECHVIFLFWQNFPLKRFALWSLERDSSFIPLLT